MNKILINCPYIYIKGGGGVANYYRVFNELKTIDASLFYVGSRRFYSSIFGPIKTIIQLLFDYIHFIGVIKRYDVVVVNPSMTVACLKRDAVFILLAKLFKKKTVVFWRGFNHLYFDSKIKYDYHKLLNRYFFRVDHTIVLGENIYEKLNSIGCETPYSLETTILSAELLRSDKKKFNKNKFTILFLARLEKTKGIIEALEIYSKLKVKYKHIEFLIAGNGAAYKEVEKIILAENLKDIYLLGDVRGEIKKEIFSKASVYLFPSYFEGMPNSILESMGMGVPVITTDVGGIPDFFENGKMGYMINGLNVNKFVEALEKLILSDDLESISEFNVEYAKNIFLDKVVVNRLENKLLEI